VDNLDRVGTYSGNNYTIMVLIADPT
jgi:hypothetical protein